MGFEEPGRRDELARNLLTMFTTDSAHQLEQFGQALAGGDHGTARRIVHTLKSSSATMGAMRLSTLCKQAEERLRESGGLNGTDWLGPIDKAWREACVAIENLPPDWLTQSEQPTP